jgi:hypothetical protein
MHKIKIHGLDYELCEDCGYVPTQYLIDSISNELARQQEKITSKESKTLTELSATLGRLKRKLKAHNQVI